MIPSRPLRIFISAAEPSADLHAAALIRATLARRPSAQFVGVAGPRMVSAGCEGIFDMSAHAAMLLGALGNAGRAARMLHHCGRTLRENPFDAAVVIDSPMLHFPLAARAQAAGVPVLYYIAPQLWAWGTYRLHKLRDRVEHLAVILPFEEKFFRDHGINATFVGHPLVDALARRPIDEDAVAEMRTHGQPFIALLPGSRKHVVEQILPGQIEVAEQIAREIPSAAFGVSIANPQVSHCITERLARAACPVRAYTARHAELIRAADLVLVASGTTTLEVALYGRPMIVMYNASRLFYHLVGRWMIHTPHLSLPNILAGRELVPEFMPYYNTTAPIARKAIALLHDEPARRSMVHELEELVTPLRNGRASDRTAELLLDMIDARQAH